MFGLILKRKRTIDFCRSRDLVKEVAKLDNLHKTFNEVHEADSIDQMIYLIKAQEIAVSRIIKSKVGNRQNGR